MLLRNMRLLNINKLKWAVIFAGGVVLPAVLLVLNDIAFKVDLVILFLIAYAAFRILCPGFWFGLDSVHLVRIAMSNNWEPYDNFIAFIFWSLLNGALYLAVLFLLEWRKSKAESKSQFFF